MKYISAKEFLKQSKQVQDTILDWWQPSLGDIYCNRYGMPLGDILVINNGNFNWKSFKDDVKQYGIPLLTEGQLREFIKSKGFYIDIKTLEPYYTYQLYLKVSINDYELESIEVNKYFIDNDLLSMYWKVALKIIKEDILGNGIGIIKEEIK